MSTEYKRLEGYENVGVPAQGYLDLEEGEKPVLELYVIHDRVTQQSSNVFEQVNSQSALRAALKSADDSQDFSLWRIGYKYKSGRIESIEPQLMTILTKTGVQK